MKKVNSILIVIIFISLILTACSAAPASDTGAMDGQTLVAEKCGRCHSADIVKDKQLTQAQWSDLVLRMIGKGLKVTDGEKSAIVTYLAETYK